MKKLLTATIFFTSFSLIHANPTRSITLESNVLHLVDGREIGINGETVALIKKYQSNIVDIIMGKRTTDGRAGWYEFEGNLYNAQELRKKEESLGATRSPQQSAAFEKLIQQMRDDFEAISEEFKETAKASKPIMALLIEESCKKRSRDNDSLILIWAKSKEDEKALFDRHIKSIKDFETFMTDLYNFLGDLVHSCPKAQAQFKERVDKFTKIKKLLPALNLSAVDEQKFMRFVQTKLNDFSSEDITSQTLKNLFSTFKKS